jgi:ABC-type antimicrobial peptide transport system permease subunit
LVQSMALAAQPPFSPDIEPAQMTAEGSPDSARVQQPVGEETVGAGYFATLGETMLVGREFEERDEHGPDGSANYSLPAVVNESAARKLFGSENAIGKTVRANKQTYEVVGVVKDMKDLLGFAQARLYLPLTPRDFARPPAGGIEILVRSNAGTETLEEIRKEIALIDPNLNLFNMEMLSAYLDRARSALQFSIRTYGAIGVFGLVLAAIGLAGVTAYAVAQRRKEIAIRTALGASKAQVVRLVLREGVGLVCVGTALGFLGALGLARVVAALTNLFAEALKFGTNDPLLLIGAPLMLAAVAMLACYLPARRSAQISPLQALREE